jgi:hypothetical protein
MAKRPNPLYWQKHLDACKQSELTQKDYCAQQGLSEPPLVFLTRLTVSCLNWVVYACLGIFILGLLKVNHF